MTVVHIVLFTFKPSLSQEQVNDACGKMLALQEKCRHPQTGEKYITSHGGGKNSSPEGLNKGATHGFVFEFANTEDRDYYLDKDPVHVDFKSFVGELVDDVTVFDFTSGVDH